MRRKKSILKKLAKEILKNAFSDAQRKIGGKK